MHQQFELIQEFSSFEMIYDIVKLNVNRDLNSLKPLFMLIHYQLVKTLLGSQRKDMG